MKIRILPVVIFTLVLFLGVRLVDFWGLGGIARSLAQQAALRKDQPPVAPIPSAAANPRKIIGPANAEGKDGTPANVAPKGSGTRAGNGALPNDPALLSPAEIDLLQKLSERHKKLDQWARDLDMREQLLKAAEQRINRKVGELKEIQVRVKAMLKQYDKEQERKLKSLVKIYENMKPKDAAPIFMELDLPILLDVVERMREAKVAPILAKMEPKKAKTVTAELAKRRKLAGDRRRKLPSTVAAKRPGKD